MRAKIAVGAGRLGRVRLPRHARGLLAPHTRARALHLLCLPFLIALAVYRRVWLTPLTILVLVGTFEMTSFRWVDSHNLADEATRTFANVLAMLAVAALAWSYAVLLLPQRRGRV